MSKGAWVGVVALSRCVLCPNSSPRAGPGWIGCRSPIGTKAEWEKEPSTESSAEELTHLLNVIITLADLYEIDLDEGCGRKCWGE